MQLFTKAQFRQLLKNGDPILHGKDHVPVVKLFTPDANATWLLTEIDPYDYNMAFGLCDLGLGFPELGYVYLPEITILGGKLGLPVERDSSFRGKYPISIYAQAAHLKSGITTRENDLSQAAAVLKKHQ